MGKYSDLVNIFYIWLNFNLMSITEKLLHTTGKTPAKHSKNEQQL